MPSISTDSSSPYGRIASACRRSRGNAEVELLLVIPVLLAVLFLANAAFKLGTARITNSYHVELDAYSQVTIGQNVSSTGGGVVPGFSTVRPGLVVRTDRGFEEQRVNFTFGNTGLRPVNITDSVYFIAPDWQYAAWPHADDQAQTQSWFTAYVDESHPPELVYSLGLQPPWRP